MSIDNNSLQLVITYLVCISLQIQFTKVQGGENYVWEEFVVNPPANTKWVSYKCISTYFENTDKSIADNGFIEVRYYGVESTGTSKLYYSATFKFDIGIVITFLILKVLC